MNPTKNLDKPTTIVKAAIRYRGGIFIGHRHNIIRDQMIMEFGSFYLKQDMQGFLTSEGDFVSRSEAADIAFKAGQIPSGIYSLDSYQIFK